jgi:hypothetical protein
MLNFRIPFASPSRPKDQNVKVHTANYLSSTSTKLNKVFHLEIILLYQKRTFSPLTIFIPYNTGTSNISEFRVS